jgi:hypothetical protein
MVPVEDFQPCIEAPTTVSGGNCLENVASSSVQLLDQDRCLCLFFSDCLRSVRLLLQFKELNLLFLDADAA